MSAPDASAAAAAAGPTTYGTIIVVGGGCYGSYYVRQLHRAVRAGAMHVADILVVDRDASCRVAGELAARPASEPIAPVPTRVVVAEWREFFTEYLSAAPAQGDAIVPSPLMPHLMAEWLVARARARWPDRTVRTRPFEHVPSVPWERAGEDGVHYVSFATWMCPINCIEPRVCPHTRELRSWSLPDTLAEYARDEAAAGRPTTAAVLHCRHRAYGVGMFDTAEVLAADDAIRRAGAEGAAEVVIGTVSHCHGALARLVIEAPLAAVDSHVR